MNAQDLDAFYHANLYINIGTLNNDRQLRGRIVQNLIGPAQELSKSPILLESSPPNRTMVKTVKYLLLKELEFKIYLGSLKNNKKIFRSLDWLG